MLNLNDNLSLPLARGLASEIAARLTKAILSGQLGPGERLREEALAASFGVSRGPLREAFALLERQGLIVVRRNRGAYVARLKREDVEEIYSLRRAIEQLAMQRAIQFADQSHFDTLQCIVDAMATYETRGVTEQDAAQHDIDFHEGIYRAARHQRLLDCWTNIRPQIQIMLLSRNVANGDFREYAAKGHQGLLDSLKARDERLALRLLDDHLSIAYDRVIHSYPHD